MTSLWKALVVFSLLTNTTILGMTAFGWFVLRPAVYVAVDTATAAARRAEVAGRAIADTARIAEHKLGQMTTAAETALAYQANAAGQKLREETERAERAAVVAAEMAALSTRRLQEMTTEWRQRMPSVPNPFGSRQSPAPASD